MSCDADEHHKGRPLVLELSQPCGGRRKDGQLILARANCRDKDS